MGLFKGEFFSNSLHMTTSVNVIFPEESNDVTPVISDSLRVVYLLHGLGSNCNEWLRFSKIEYYAKKYNFIVIMPGVGRTFYSNMEYGLNYFDYISQELPEICKKWFNIPTKKELTFIAGESMGGYGAMKIALTHLDHFAAVATLSGVLDYKAMAQRILSGESGEVTAEELYAIHGQTKLPKDEEDLFFLLNKSSSEKVKPRVIQLCGTEDFLYMDNKKFKEEIEKLDFDYHYMEWRGDHEWPFWDVAIQKALQFFLKLDVEKTPIY